MSKTAIVKSGENFFIKQLSKSQPIKLDRVIFANVPGINSNTDINADEKMPTSNQIVHTAPVTQSGLLNDRTVVYSVILDTSVGDFSFNYIGLVNAETNTLCMVMHTDLTKKIKTTGQRQGNTITESIWLEMDNASESTGVTVNAQTWQIDYSKRLAGEDERIRLTNYDLYNRLVILNGFTVTKNNNQLNVSPGLAYVAGLRVENQTQKSIKVDNNQSLYIDAWLTGTVTGQWSVNYNLIAGTNLKDYDKDGFKHFVELIASVDAGGKLSTVKTKYYLTSDDLSSKIDSIDENKAATSQAVKKVYDLASRAVKKSGDTMTGQLILSEFGIKHKYNDSENLMVSRTRGDNYAYIFYDAEKKQWQDKLIYNSTKNSWSFQYVDDVTINDKSLLNNYVPVGVPLPWPKSTPPAGWLKCNGWKFDKNKYPKLGEAYPSGYLPEMRGEFIRGWDDGRGVDSGREILSWQAQQIAAHRHVEGWGETTVGFNDLRKEHYAPFGSTGTTGVWCGASDKDFDNPLFYTNDGTNGSITTSRGTTYWNDLNPAGLVGNETRSRNIAFMYIVKAE